MNCPWFGFTTQGTCRPPEGKGRTLRISRLRLHDFRGWSDLDIRPQRHVLLAGVPRAGRSDIIAAISRVLDPALIRTPPSLGDLRRHTTPCSSSKSEADTAEEGSDGEGAEPSAGSSPSVEGGGSTHRSPVVAAYAEAEVTLVDLCPEVEQLCDGFLEPLGEDDQVDISDNAGPDAPLGVRLAYRVSYDPDADSLEHLLYFPARSDPTTEQYAKVSSALRRALPVVVLSSERPLQLRAEGVLRRLVTERDPGAATAAFRSLERSVAEATDCLTSDENIAETIDSLLRAGGLAQRLSETALTAAAVRFRPEDGSLSALLRAVQPALMLDDAGLLPLPNHGSTTKAVLTAAEAMLLATAQGKAVVLGDDFGEDLDAATAEHLTAMLRARAGQMWFSTRRPEVARAFAPPELIRLSRLGDSRGHHVLPEPSDKKEIAVRRLLHMQLLPALTAPTVVIVEGPHDLTTYTSADRHIGMANLPLAAFGVRLISADNGSGGGTGQIPRVADLAHTLGFRVIALIDRDPDKTSAATLGQIEGACDVVVRLPPDTAIEQALQSGIDIRHLRAAAAVLPAFGIPDPSVGKSDEEVSKAIAHALHRKGLHEQFLDAVVEQSFVVPPVVEAALTAVASAASTSYSGPSRIDLPQPAATAAVNNI